MVENQLSVTIGIVVSTLAGGGVAAAVFEFIRDLFLRRREEFVDTTKTKINALAKSATYLSNMGFICSQISVVLGEKPVNSMLLFYSICRFFYLVEKFNKDVGELFFDSRHANLIVDNIASDLGEMIYTKTDVEFLLRLPDLVNIDTTYDQFCVNLLNCSFRFTQFEAFLKQLSSEEIEEFDKRFRWFRDVYIIETGFAYNSWYGEKPYLDDISLDLFEYLKTNYPTYHKRVDSLRKDRLFRERKIRASS